jgi:hypothetical protein
MGNYVALHGVWSTRHWLSATDVDRRRLIDFTIVRDSARCVVAGGEVPGITAGSEAAVTTWT